MIPPQKNRNMRQIMVVNYILAVGVSRSKRVDYGHSMLCVGNLHENIVCNNVFNVTILRI